MHEVSAVYFASTVVADLTIYPTTLKVILKFLRFYKELPKIVNAVNQLQISRRLTELCFWEIHIKQIIPSPSVWRAKPIV